MTMRPSARKSKVSLPVILALVCIAAVAAGLRLYQLDRVPPGLSYDEALNDLFALRIRTLLPPPVFIPSEFGEEPAHMVLIAALYRLAGHPFAEAGRLASALGGILAVVTLFLAAREMFRQSAGEDEANVIGLLSAGTLAILYWHVHYSRLGMEPTMVPTFSAPAFYLFWLALNRQRWMLFALAGAALGLCLYTYAAGYLLPLVVVIYLAWRWMAVPNTFRTEWRCTLAYVAGAGIIYAPHMLFFIQHPEWLTNRPQAAASKSGVVEVLLNAARMVGGLVWRGDTNLRLNLPGRPALDLVQSVALVGGLWCGLRRPQRSGTIFVVIWLIIMLMPSVFSDVAPHFGRAVGATPPLAILVGLGLAEISNFKFQISNPRVARIGFIVVIAGALGYSTIKMVRDYFVTWARDPGLFTAFDVGLRESAEYLASLPRDEWISFSPVDRDQPIFRFTFRDDVSHLKTYNGRRCAVYPVELEHDLTHVAVVAEDTHSLDVLQRVFPSGQVERKFWDAGTRWAVAYHVNAGNRAQTSLDEVALFGEGIALVGTQSLRTSVHAGEALSITLTWESLATVRTNYTIFVHLAPALDVPLVAQEDAQPCDNSYPTTWWSPGEIVEEDRRIVIPAGTPPGQYVLTTGIYDWATGQRLPVRSTDKPLGDQFVLGIVSVTR
jgi:hypothetical protein